MVCLLEDMWEVSGTVCKQARSATVSAQHSSKANLIKLGSSFQTSEFFSSFEYNLQFDQEHGCAEFLQL